MGYERIKEKVKGIRQDYRRAVTEGRRSNSGKLALAEYLLSLLHRQIAFYRLNHIRKTLKEKAK